MHRICILLLYYKSVIYLFIFWLWNKLMAFASRLPDGVEGTATNQVVQQRRIWFTNQRQLSASYYSFISTHMKYISIEELMKKQISLHSISLETQSAYFVEFHDGDNPYNTRKYSILHISQGMHSKYLYIIPLNAFYRYMDTLDVTSRRVVWLHHSVRCGSTVWSQVFNALPKWGAVSEIRFLLHAVIHEQPDDVVTFSKSDEFSKMAVAGFKFYISRFPADYSIFVKTDHQESYMLECIPQHFTNMHILYCYRNILPSAQSWYKLVAKIRLGYWQVMEEKIGKNPFSKEHAVRLLIQFYTQSWPRSLDMLHAVVPQSMVEWYVVLWCSSHLRLLSIIQRKHLQIKCIKYEDMQEDCENVVTKLFKYLGIDVKLVPTAMIAASQDSQQDNYLSGRNPKTNEIWTRPEDSVKKCNEILDFLGFPDLDSDYTMPNTL